MKNIFLGACATLFLFSSCKEDPQGVTTEPPVARQAIIGVEGVNPNGISSIGVYDILNQSLNNNVYRKANLTTLGSGLSDIYVDEETKRFFAVLPSSEKMAVCDLNTFELIKNVSITEGVRKIKRVAENKYYLTSWDDAGILVKGGEGFNTYKIIPTAQAPTDMIQWENLVFVSNTGLLIKDNTVTILNADADTVIATLQVGENPTGMAIDLALNQLFILSAGELNSQNPTLSGLGSLWRYNLDSMRTAIDSGTSIQFDTVLYFNDNQIKPHHLAIDDEGRNLYYLSNAPTGDIMRMKLEANRVSETPMITGNFYGIKFDPTADELYGLNTPSSDIDGTGSFQIYAPDGSLKVSQRIGSKPKEVDFK